MGSISRDSSSSWHLPKAINPQQNIGSGQNASLFLGYISNLCYLQLCLPVVFCPAPPSLKQTASFLLHLPFHSRRHAYHTIRLIIHKRKGKKIRRSLLFLNLDFNEVLYIITLQWCHTSSILLDNERFSQLEILYIAFIYENCFALYCEYTLLLTYLRASTVCSAFTDRKATLDLYVAYKSNVSAWVGQQLQQETLLLQKVSLSWKGWGKNLFSPQ